MLHFSKGQGIYMINLNEVGAFGSVDPSGNLSVRFGVYLPGIWAADGFEVVVRIIHRDDRFDAAIPTQDFSLDWVSGHPLGLWAKTVTLGPLPNTHFGQHGTYLYRYQLWWKPPGGERQLLTRWFTDPFARATDVGELAAVSPRARRSSFQLDGCRLQNPGARRSCGLRAPGGGV